MAYKPSPQTLARAALARSKMSASKKAAPAVEKKPAAAPEEEKGRSAAAAKKVNVAPRKLVAIDPGSVRAVNAARQQAYMAKGGRQPIGAMGSGGSNVMAGGGHGTVKDIKASIKAGVNPRVSLDPYEGERAKKVGPRTLKKEEVQVDEANMRFDYEAAARPKSSDVKNFLNRNKNARAAAASNKYIRRMTKLGGLGPNQTKKDTEAHMKAHFEEVQVNEGAKEDAEKLLGGPVKTKPANAPAGKLPYGFRRSRNLARQAMKAGKSVTESTTEVTEVNEMSHGKALAKMIMAKKSKHPIAQHMGEAKDPGEYDYEGDMAMSQLKSVITNAQKLHDMLEPDTNLPEWVQSKITLAEDYIVTAANYMSGELDEEVELDEAHMTDAQMKRREKYVKSMKSADWEKRYPGRGEKVMYATATKMAMKEELDEATKPNLKMSDYPHFHKYASGALKARGDINSHSGIPGDTEIHHSVKGHLDRAESELKAAKEKGHNLHDLGAAADEGKHHGFKHAYKMLGKAYYSFEEVAREEEAEKLDEVTGYEGVKNRTDIIKRAVAMKRMGKDVFLARVKARAAEMKKEKKEKTNEEAEGSVPKTPREKELAAHHGDPNRITRGDVIKARLKAAAKKDE